MTKQKSIISEIITRKIPQVIGMYIASAWLGMEISDWMSSRFDLSVQLSTYVFVGMLLFLPAVVLLAWGHGKPGKDEWSLLEKLWIPTNLLACTTVLIYFVNPIIGSNQTNKSSTLTDAIQAIESQEPLAVMKKMSVVDVETGSEVTYEVGNKAFHQSVISYFWDNKSNDSTLDWLSYGASWLLSQDLKRTPLISVQTVYDSEYLLNQLVEKGFDKALNVPLALARKIAENKSIKWFVQGSFEKVKNDIKFTAYLYDTKTGVEINSFSATDSNWLTALDLISGEISEVILSSAKVAKNIIPQLAIAEHTSNSMEAIRLLIQAKNSIAFDNDYTAGIDHLLHALKVDSKFADANVTAMANYVISGDIANATVHAKSALELDYKLYKETEFLVKANLFALKGEQGKTIKVLENWVKIYPQSIEALKILGNNYIGIGHHQEQAKEVYEKLFELEGEGTRALVSLGKIYRLQNNKDSALKYLTKYKDANISNSSAYFELAEAYKQFGLLTEAREMYEESSLYNNDDINAELALAKLVSVEGNYKESISQLNALLGISKSDKQKWSVLSVLIDLYISTGQIEKALALHVDMAKYGSKILPPIAALFQLQGAKIGMFISVGQFDQALSLVDELSKELKPPYDKLLGAFAKEVYQRTKDIENYKKSLAELNLFVVQFNIAVLKPDLLRSEGKLLFWEGDYEGSLILFDEALIESKQSFVTLISSQEIDGLRYDKARSLIGLGRYEQAIENLDIAITRSPLFAKAYHQKAIALQGLNKIDEMHAEIQKAHLVWRDADSEYLQYKELIEFEKSLNP